MIITDTSSESTRKSTLGSSSEQGSDERSSLLTNRREEQEGGGAPPPYGAYSQDGMIDTPGAGDGGKVALGRFFKSLGVAVLIWFLGWAVLSSILMPYDRPKWKHRPSRNVVQPRPSDGTIIQCEVPWSSTNIKLPPIIIESRNDGSIVQPPYSSSMSLRMPVSSPHLSMFSRGVYSHGGIRFVADESLAGEQVVVDIRSGYWSLEVRDLANICLLENAEGGKRLAILTPGQLFNIPPKEELRIVLDIVVRFPSQLANLRAMGTLDTNLPWFYHEMGEMDDHLTFESISLTTSDSGIRSGSLTAQSITLKTTNKQITGKFNVTEKLDLATTRADIKASIQLYNEENYHKPTALLLLTTNGQIQSDISLHSTKHLNSTTSGGWFDVSALTSNGQIQLSFPDSPHTSKLILHASTSNSMTNVSLHPAFEGRVSLRTTGTLPQIKEGAGTEDPSGRNQRRRLVVQRVVNGAVDASVVWGDDKDHRELGQVQVVTSNGPSILRLP